MTHSDRSAKQEPAEATTQRLALVWRRKNGFLTLKLSKNVNPGDSLQQ